MLRASDSGVQGFVVLIIAMAYSCVVRLAQSPWSQHAQCRPKTVKNSAERCSTCRMLLHSCTNFGSMYICTSRMHFSSSKSFTASLYNMVVLKHHIMAGMSLEGSLIRCRSLHIYAHRILRALAAREPVAPPAEP